MEQLPFTIATATPNLFPLPWSLYFRLMSVKDDFARGFYEDEAIVAGWSVRQLHRMIPTQHYERTLLSKNKASMLLKGREAKPEDVVTLEETIRDPYVLEFLNLKDEYSETDLEEAIIKHLESFLLEMGYSALEIEDSVAYWALKPHWQQRCIAWTLPHCRT